MEMGREGSLGDRTWPGLASGTLDFTLQMQPALPSRLNSRGNVVALLVENVRSLQPCLLDYKDGDECLSEQPP